MLPLVCRASSCIPASAMTAARDRRPTVILVRVHHPAGTGKEHRNAADFTEGINPLHTELNPICQ